MSSYADYAKISRDFDKTRRHVGTGLLLKALRQVAASLRVTSRSAMHLPNAPDEAERAYCGLGRQSIKAEAPRDARMSAIG